MTESLYITVPCNGLVIKSVFVSNIFNIMKGGMAFERKLFISVVPESCRIDAKVHLVLSYKENVKGTSGYVKAKHSSATVTAVHNFIHKKLIQSGEMRNVSKSCPFGVLKIFFS